MNIVYINGWGPRDKTPYSSIFVTKRIQALHNLGLPVQPVVYDVVYSSFFQFLLKLKGIEGPGRPLKEQLDVLYSIKKVRINLIEAVLGKYFPAVLQRKIYKTFCKEYGKAKPDMIHLHAIWPLGLGLSKLFQKKGIPYVLTCHGSEINITMKHKWYTKTFIEMLENAFCVEFVSQALLHTAIEQGYSGKNAKIVRNGIDTEDFCCENIEREERTVVGYVGNLLPVKGADRLPEIFEQIWELCDHKVQFAVIGIGALEEELKAKMKQLPVTFRGYLSADKLAEEYRKMKVMVIPSRKEGYSCVTKEAQACGVIPVGVSVGGIPEAVGSFGCVVEGETQEEICQKLAKEASAYYKGEKTINLEEMIQEVAKETWEYYQKESIHIYETISENK